MGAASNLASIFEPVVKAGGAHDDLMRARRALSDALRPHMSSGTPNEYDETVGHYGVGGEYGNGIGTGLTFHIEPAIKKGDPDSLSRAALSFLHYSDKQSQRSKIKGTPEQETSAEALFRAGRAIEEWLLLNKDRITDDDRKKITDAMPLYWDALNRISEAIGQARALLTNDNGSHPA